MLNPMDIADILLFDHYDEFFEDPKEDNMQEFVETDAVLMDNYFHDPDGEEEVEELAEQGIWVTKDGEEISIKDMTAQHLVNALNFIRKKGDQFLLNLYEKQFEKEIHRRSPGNPFK